MKIAFWIVTITGIVPAITLALLAIGFYLRQPTLNTPTGNGWEANAKIVDVGVTSFGIQFRAGIFFPLLILVGAICFIYGCVALLNSK